MTRKWLAIATMLWVCPATAPSAAQTPRLQLTATYATGLSGDNAEVVSVRSDGIAVASNTAGSVDVLDLSDPFAPRRLIRVPVDTTTVLDFRCHPSAARLLSYCHRAGGANRQSVRFRSVQCELLDPLPWAFSRTPWSFRQMACLLS